VVLKMTARNRAGRLFRMVAHHIKLALPRLRQIHVTGMGPIEAVRFE
jgi:hypothetical protein